MKRRTVVASLAAATTTPFATRAQQSLPLVGFVAASARQEHFERAFITALRDQGFVRGRTVELEFHWTAGRFEPVRGIIGGLIERRAAAIVAGGGNVTLAARALTSIVPIVFATSTDPVGDELVASLARPGGNVTGLSLQSTELAPKLIEVLRDLLPRITRIAVIYPTTSRTIASRRAVIAAAARSVGIVIVELGVSSPQEFERVIADAASSADAAIVLRDYLTEANSSSIVTLASRHRLPVIYEQPEHVRAGGLISYAADFTDLHRRAAGYVARILRGASPADLPVEQPVRFELVINLRAARALGLSPPDALLDNADEVIE